MLAWLHADCPSADALLSLMPSELLFYGAKFNETTSLRVSMAHLMQLQSRQVLQVLDDYLSFLHRHMQACKACIRATPTCASGLLCTHVAASHSSTLVFADITLDMSMDRSLNVSGIVALDDSSLLAPAATMLPLSGLDVLSDASIRVCWSCLQVAHPSCLRLTGDCLNCAAETSRHPEELLFNLYERADHAYF